MKRHFEPDLDYQHTAIEAVCDLFRGQEICRTEFTVTHGRPSPTGVGRQDQSSRSVAC
jgi:type III restriction enzyme